jgi:uncharacterized membrane protein (UPF0127 family)
MPRIVLLAIVLAGCSNPAPDASPEPTPTNPPAPSDRPASTVEFRDADARLFVEVAATPEDRRRGLMGVTELPADEGMAFLFDEPVSTSFWMKGTLIPLSIAFVGKDARVIGILDMEPCDADPCPTYGVDRPFVLAIEANVGWFEEHGVAEGDRAHLRGDLGG